MKNFLRKTLLLAILGLTLTMPLTSTAALPGREGVKDVAGRAGISADSEVDIFTIVGGFIRVALGILGVVFLILIIYGGFIWMTAGGNQDQVTKAKGILRNAVIGTLIVAAAYAITTFVFGQIQSAV